jgi:hypothetical protein
VGEQGATAAAQTRRRRREDESRRGKACCVGAGGAGPVMVGITCGPASSSCRRNQDAGSDEAASEASPGEAAFASVPCRPSTGRGATTTASTHATLIKYRTSHLPLHEAQLRNCISHASWCPRTTRGFRITPAQLLRLRLTRRTGCVARPAPQTRRRSGKEAANVCHAPLRGGH